MIDTLLIATGVLGVFVAALSGRLRGLPVSVPLLALVVGVVLGPSVTGALPVPLIIEVHAPYHEAARILLAVSVMAVGLRYPLRQVARHRPALLVLLAVVMPVMAAVTAGLAAAILGVGFAVAVLLGVALWTTDPVLAS